MILRIALVLAFMAVGPGIAFAQYHQTPALVCSDCHSMHASDVAGGPYPHLVKVSSINALCLSCHDGTDTTAPDVQNVVTMYNGGAAEIDRYSAAGYYPSAIGVADANSHNLGISSTVPLRSGAPASMTLTCTSCHNAHGTTNYRNLISDPDGSGSGTTIVLGTNVFQNNAPQVPPTQAGSIAAYKRSNIGYKSNYSAWCSECHNVLASNAAGSSPAHFQRHPSNVALNTAGYHVDATQWVNGTIGAFGTTTGDATYGVPRVRFQAAPAAANFAQATTVANTNQVFCGSCHLAHGWRYNYCLVMPLKIQGGVNNTDGYAPCNQCHNK